MQKRVFLLLLLFLIMISGLILADDILELEEIEAGMTGIGKTVFQGLQVEEFPVEIISILDNDLILIRADGEQINSTGGIAAGMSGSPIYIDHKLIGAIGYGFADSDHRFALVTPIKSMLELTKEIDREFLHKNKLSTPLLVSGLKNRSLERLEKFFAPYRVEVLQGGGLSKYTREEISLEPGSAVAVQLVRGDINIAAIGTLSYITDNKFLSFAHPFLNKGQVDYLISPAYINGIIPNKQQPFKLASPVLEPFGAVRVDRGAGIAGKMGVNSQIVSLRVKVSDDDLALQEQINAQIVNDQDLLTSLAINIALQAIDETIDRIGVGTAQVSIEILANNLPERQIYFENMYCSLSDVAAVSLADLYNLLHLITNNPFQEIELLDIIINVEVEEKTNVALIQEVKVLNEKIKAGDILELEITFRPYRQETETKIYYLEVPESFSAGIATIAIEGGFTAASFINYSLDNLEGQRQLNHAEYQGYTDFNTMLTDYLKRTRNNQLVIRLNEGYRIKEEKEDTILIDNEIIEIEETPDDHSLEDIEKEQKEQEEKQEIITVNLNKEIIEEEQEKREAEAMKNEIKEEEDEKTETKKIITSDYVLEGYLFVDIEIEDFEEKD